MGKIEALHRSKNKWFENEQLTKELIQFVVWDVLLAVILKKAS